MKPQKRYANNFLLISFGCSLKMPELNSTIKLYQSCLHPAYACLSTIFPIYQHERQKNQSSIPQERFYSIAGGKANYCKKYFLII